MIKVILGLNSMDPNSWTTHDVEDLSVFLLSTFPEGFPETGKIFHEKIDLPSEVTPDPKLPETIQRLLDLTGTLYIIVYPAGAMIIGNTALTVAALTIDWLLHHDKKKDVPPRFDEQTGSPNNKLGDRKNTARVLGRIPDIYGDVRAFPDLLALPYTTYNDHREVETAYMCVGRGSFIITDMRDGDMFVSEIAGMSAAVYDPGQMPTLDVPVVQIGDPISDPVYIVKRLEAVNGQTLLPDNAFTFIGETPVKLFTGDSVWQPTLFRNDGPGFGLIFVGGTPDEVLDKVKVGDRLDVLYPPDHFCEPNLTVNPISRNGASGKQIQLFQAGTGTIPNLTGTGVNGVTVTAITTASPILSQSTIRVSIPPSMQAQWNLITSYTAGWIVPGAIGNGACLITPQGAEWVGPFFLQVNVSPPRDQVVICNFVAQSGLFADDGKNIKGFSVRIEVELTPCTNNGTPTGDPVQTESTVVIGTIASRNTRAATLRIVPAHPGSFKIRARRITRTPWKQDSPSQYVCLVLDRVTGLTVGTFSAVPALALTGPRLVSNTGSATNPNDGAPLYVNSSYLPFHGNSQDELVWAGCYSLVDTEFSSFGNITTIHTRTIQTRSSSQVKDRRLNCFARRLINTWDGTTFGGALVQNRQCENILFMILKDQYLGNLANSLIDFPGIAASFAAVRAMFGGPTSGGFGGDEAGQFNYTFDDEKTTLEEMVSIVCTAGFCVPYRLGDVVKVRPELATTVAEMIVNHRSRKPGTEQRTVTFGTDADFDGVRLDYTEVDINDPTNYAVKTYTIPPNSVALRPKQLQIPGIRLKKHAAWHAWREYNKLLYANTITESEVCEEAMQLGISSRVLMSDSTRTKPQDGEIVAISGTTITTSQPVDVSSGPHTIYLQHTDGTVQTIPVSAGPTTRQLVLGSAPAVAVVTDGDLGVRTLYLLVKNDFTPPTAFLVTEKRCTNDGTYLLSAVNYSHAFYWNDGMMFWLPFIVQSGLTGARDWGPYELATSSSGSIVTDVVRGDVYAGTAVNQDIHITTSNVFASASYTKSSWVKKTGASQNFAIIDSAEADDEFFDLNPGETLIAGHNNISYIVFATGAVVGDWHMYTLTYDSVTLSMRSYMDGEIAAISSPVPARPLGNLRIYGCRTGVSGALGRGDDCRYWMRVLAPEEIRELYQKTKI